MFMIAAQVQRLFALFRDSASARQLLRSIDGVPHFRSEQEFERLVRQEISRCIRRPRKHEFAVIQVTILNEADVLPQMLKSAIEEVQRRARITDELGLWRDKVSVLLPETGREGGLHFLSKIEDAFSRQKVSVELALFVYPWDDLISNRSGELDSIEIEDFNETVTIPEAEKSEPGPDSVINATTEQRTMSSRGASEITLPTTAKSLNFKGSQKIAVGFSTPTPVWKRAIDLMGGSILLLGLAPVMLAVAWLIRRDSPGPAIFTQMREGKDGKAFKIYKFRTMKVGAEEQQAELRNINEQDGPAFKIGDDPRVTKLGRFLRKACIDELPQLINVVRGEMSLVGPRPLPVRESAQCKMWHRQRLQVLPGLTCIWQVFGGRNVSFEQWMRMDLEYLERRGFWFDLKLIGFTILKVAMQKGSV